MADIELDKINWGIDAQGNYYPLTAALDINYPAIDDVRNGTAYGYSSQYIGTLVVTGGGCEPTSTGDLLDRGSSWLGTIRKAHMSKDVVYKRGSTTTATIKATLGRTQFAMVDPAGGAVTYESKDFIIQVADFSAFTLPEAGDIVISEGLTYEVMAPGSEPVWRWSDPYQRTLRIHSKLTKRGV